MKTIEIVKEEFKNATGKELPIYTYDGKLGVLYEVKHYSCWAPDFIPMDEFLSKDDIDYDRVRWVTVGAEWSEEGEEITERPVRNEENDQCLLVDCVWSPVDYNKSDEFVRQLLVTTDRYYRWTSERKKMIDAIQQTMESYTEELSCYDGVADDDLTPEEIKGRDEQIESLRCSIEILKENWESTCSEYEDPLGWSDYEHNTIDFENVYEEAISYGRELSGIVKMTALEAIKAE